MDNRRIFVEKIRKKWAESGFVSAHRTGFRLLKMVHETDSTVLPMNLLMICVNLAEIYAVLFLTSALIDSLLAADFRQAAGYALLLAASALALGSMGEVLLKKVRTVQYRLWQIVYLWIAKKAISLDYETMEDPDAVKKLLSAERTCDMYGSVGVVVLNYGELLKALLNIVISVGLSLRLVLNIMPPSVGTPPTWGNFWPFWMWRKSICTAPSPWRSAMTGNMSLPLKT